MNKYALNQEIIATVSGKLQKLAASSDGQVRVEAQENWQYLFAVIDLPMDTEAGAILKMSDEATEMLNSCLQPRSGEPRWMLSFHVKGQTLYAIDGGAV